MVTQDQSEVMWLLGKSGLFNDKTKGLFIHYLSMTGKAMGPAQYFIQGEFKKATGEKEKRCCLIASIQWQFFQ